MVSDSRYGPWVITHNDVVIERFDTGKEAVSHYKDRNMTLDQGFHFRQIRFEELEREEKLSFFEERLRWAKELYNEPYSGRLIDISVKLYPNELEWLLQQIK